MSDKTLAFKGIAELSSLYRRREVSPVEVVETFLERIDRLEGTLNHFITVMGEQALEAARHAESNLSAGTDRGPLHGIPISLKDIIFTRGVRTTCASKVMEAYVPDHDATVVARLQEEGAIILGKVNAQEFAMGPTGAGSHFGPARNPWNVERVTGGSSSGSGGSVAVGTSTASIGTDTGGSVRIPAALCGLVGHKPTYGLVSRYGIMPLAHSADHAGPLTRSVEDAAIVLQAMAGHDEKDASTVAVPVPDYRASLAGGVEGMRMGIVSELLRMPHHPEVETAMYTACETLEGLGASITEVSVPMLEHVRKFHPVFSMCEASWAHYRMFLEHREDYGPEVKRRLDLAMLLAPADYLLAQQAREELRQQAEEAFTGADVLLSPTCPVPAPEIARDTMEIHGVEEHVWGWLANYTCGFNDTGHPATTVPCGFSSEGLPLGLQIAAKGFQDAVALRAAHAYEQATRWHTYRPPLGG